MPMKIRIVGTLEECQVASDRIARVFDARYVGRPRFFKDRSRSDEDNPRSMSERMDEDLYQVNIEARLREQDHQG
jgi:hypothetical protein